MNDMRVRMLPTEWVWPYNGLPGFLPIYDEDTVTIYGQSVLDVSIDLCSGKYVPCLLSIMGSEDSSLSRTGAGKLGCHASLGCTAILLQHVTLLCNKDELAETGPLQISGKSAALIISNSSISGCSSVQDGGSVRMHDGATLTLSESSISHSSSQVHMRHLYTTLSPHNFLCAPVARTHGSLHISLHLGCCRCPADVH